MSARAEILGRVRAAAGAGVLPAVPRHYRQTAEDRPGTRLKLFCERATDFGAGVHRVAASELEPEIARRCAALGAKRLAMPPLAPWRPPGVEMVFDDHPLGPLALDDLGAALTGCTLAIAETGTLVLACDGVCGRRALSLIPDLHLCVVGATDIVATVPEAIAKLAGPAADGRPLTFVSGPSATSDIELERVEGVHGPRRLELFVVADA